MLTRDGDWPGYIKKRVHKGIKGWEMLIDAKPLKIGIPSLPFPHVSEGIYIYICWFSF